jgi:hypothetical protein
MLVHPVKFLEMPEKILKLLLDCKIDARAAGTFKTGTFDLVHKQSVPER